MPHSRLRDSPWTVFLTLIFASLVSSHTVIVYPGWRGNNLHTNGTVEETETLGAAVAANDSGLVYPYGMQWMYPCGGMPLTENRTKWPVEGGAVGFQPGWFPGHETAFLYINLGLGTVPENMSHPMLAPFQIEGPANDPYPGTFCMPQVPLPAGLDVSIGDNATIQVIETAVHGAALYSCVDITFADPSEVAEVNETNCFNSSTISSNFIYATKNDKNIASSTRAGLTLTTPLLLASYFLLGL